MTDVAESLPPGQGPGGKFVGATGIVVTLLLLLVFSILLLYSLLKLWPHVGEEPKAIAPRDSTVVAGPASGPGGFISAPSPRAGKGALDRNGYLVCAPNDSTGIAIPTADTARGADCIVWFGKKIPVWIEQRLLVIVLLTGALGAILHALRSMAWYIGNRQLVWSWLAFYMCLPLVDSLMAGSFYMIVRGGFFSGTSIQATNTFGFAALGVLIGMFTTPAVLKLKEVAETVLTRPQPGADTAPQQAGAGGGTTAASGPPVVTSIERQRRSAGAAREALLIKGTGFNAAATVQVNGQVRPAEPQSAEAILLPLSDDDTMRIDAGGDFVIIVANPGGAMSKPFDFA